MTHSLKALRESYTAAYVARVQYRDGRAIDTALYEHARRVLDARLGRRLPRDLEGHRAELAAQPLLTRSEATIMVQYPLCGICRQGRQELFQADSVTHRVINRSGDPVDPERCWLCVPCWSRFRRDDGDSPDLPDKEVFWC